MLAFALPMQSNLAGTWAAFWGKLTTPLAGIITILTFVGIALIVGGVLKYFWDRRRGGANTGQLLWAIGIGALLVTPNALLPILLRLADMIVNTFANLAS